LLPQPRPLHPTSRASTSIGTMRRFTSHAFLVIIAQKNLGSGEMPSPADDRLVDILRLTVAALVPDEGRDLPARQLAVFLICYLTSDKQTVRGLADQLRIPRASVTYALDRLEELDLAQRRPDPTDRRSVLVHQTARGNAFLRDLSKIMADAERATRSTRSAHR
jgi:DNA-binding MarR family transcriptional regulator